MQACYQVLNEKQPGWYSNPLNILMLVKEQLSCYHLGMHTLKASLSGPSQTLGTRGCCSQSRCILGQQTLMQMVVSKGAFLYRHSAVFNEQMLLSSRSFHFRPNSCEPVRTDHLCVFTGAPAVSHVVRSGECGFIRDTQLLFSCPEQCITCGGCDKTLRKTL